VIPISRFVRVGLGAGFSAYHVVLAIYSIAVPTNPAPVVVALVLFAVVSTATLWPSKRSPMPMWLALIDLGSCVALPLLVTSQLNPAASNGYATWYVAAVGTLMTIVAVRGRPIIALVGVGFLVVHSLIWAGVASLGSLGVVGSVVWVTAAIVVTRALAAAGREAQQFANVERRAAEWQAAQEARVSERQTRLAQTSRLAAPLLTEIVRSGGAISEEQRAECRILESALRDEIRGRLLLSDAVRAEVMAARRRGTVVSLLDEGGVDDLSVDELAAVHRRLAEAVRDSRVDKLIVRTAAHSAGTAVTVVGLRSSTGVISLTDGDDDDVELWLEIPRAVDVPSPDRSGR
jgi:hypothetical protein